MLSRRHLIALTPALALPACRSGRGRALSVAATAVPHAEILDFVRPGLKQRGVDLQVRVFNDYVQPNLQVQQGQIDVNYFQTKPYLDQFNAAHGTHLVPIAGIHIEPLGAYSRRFKRIQDLPTGASVAIPNEASNNGRALLLLQRAGLIRLRNPTDPLATVQDVVANPHRLQFRELEAASLPRVLGQVDLAVINTNYALDAGLNPLRDGLLLEDSHSPYVNYVVGRPGAATNPRVIALVAALKSPDTRRFITDHYKGAVLPAF
jgi:D-methionine transport system substrate-binding protein